MFNLNLIKPQDEISSLQEIQTMGEHITWLLKKTIRKNPDYQTLQKQEGTILHQKKLRAQK